MRGRALGVLSASALAVGGMVTMAGPAAAATKTISCGQTISGNVTAANNIGPCTGGDAIKITASGTTFDLGGHSIKCNNMNNHVNKEQVGIHLIGASGVTVKNGSVSNCDAGVAISGGGNNTVTGIIAHDNVAHAVATGPVNPDKPLNTPCNYGDGITAVGSSGNTITGNVAYRNGPFSGISLVENSDNNKVIGNQVYNQKVPNLNPKYISSDNPEGLGPCGPFSATPTGLGRPDQDIGIRIEGPGANNNQVIGNQVTDNMLDGITIHGYLCLVGVPPAQQVNFPPKGSPSTGNLIKGNSVSGNGFDLLENGTPVPGGSAQGQDGIAILRQGPFGNITCAGNDNTIVGNSSTGNARYGVSVPPTADPSIPANNTVNSNVADNNGLDGIHVDGPFTVCPFGQGNQTGPSFCNVARVPYPGSNNNTLKSNHGTGNGNHIVAPNTGGRDGFDGNPACDNNNWVANIFGTVNQPCVKAGGGTGTVVGPIP